MTDTKKSTLSEIKAREQAATEGPLAIFFIGNGRAMVVFDEPSPDSGRVLMGGATIFNAKFYANARTDIPYLLELVSSLKKVLERFSSEFPVPGCGYCTITIEPDGKVTHETSCPIPEARALIEEIKL